MSESEWKRQNSLQAIEFSRECIRIAMLINGGAAVALIGLVGSSENVLIFESMRLALKLFCFGLVAAFISAALGYFAQTAFAANNGRIMERGEDDETVAIRWTVAAAVAVVASVLMFCAGVYVAGDAVFPAPKTVAFPSAR